MTSADGDRDIVAEAREAVAELVLPPDAAALIDQWAAWIEVEARAAGLDPASEDFERAWVIAGGAISKLLATRRMDPVSVALTAAMFWRLGLGGASP